MVTFDMSELRELSADLGEAKNRVGADVSKAIRTRAKETQSSARRHAPRRTGALAESIGVDFYGDGRSGGMTAVIDPYGEGTSFVVLRTEPDLSAVAETYFDVLWNQKMEEATVVTNSKLYDGVDVGAFYEKLIQLRQDMMAEMDGGAQTDDDKTGGSQSDSADDSTDDSADSAADDPQPAA